MLSFNGIYGVMGELIMGTFFVSVEQKPKKEKHYDDEDLEHLKKKKVRPMYVYK